MGSEFLSEIVYNEIREIMGKLGFEIVEIKVGRTSGMTKVTLIIYKKTGVSLKDCEEVSKIILPRIEMIEMINNVSLEVSSPGIDRVIKNGDEYRIFEGRGVMIFLKDETTHREGVIKKYNKDKNTVEIEKGNKIINIDIDKIRKAKLFDYEEG